MKKLCTWMLVWGLMLAPVLPVVAQNVISGEVIPGTYKPVAVNANGLMSASQYATAVAFGDIIGVTRAVGLGANPSVDIATVPEDVWSGGGLYPWMTAATSLEVVSTSASDAAAGVGGRTIRVVCLDINFVEFFDTITLNGLTAVAMPRQCYRINLINVLSAGTTGTNVGDINIRDAGGGTIRGNVPPLAGISKQTNYTVPAGYTLQIVSQYLSTVRDGGVVRVAETNTYIKPNGGAYRQSLTLTTGTSGVYRHDGIPGIIVLEKEDFAMRVSSVSSNGTAIDAGWLGILRKNVIP
jgi:hypothetical protein